METERFEELVAEALEGLPDQFRQLMNNVQVVVAEWPTRRQLASVRLRRPTSLLGLYEGIPLTRRTSHYGMVAPDKISIFQRPIERLCDTEDQVRQQVQDTVIHELGHHFGIDEPRMRQLERERDRTRRMRKEVGE